MLHLLFIYFFIHRTFHLFQLAIIFATKRAMRENILFSEESKLSRYFSLKISVSLKRISYTFNKKKLHGTSIRKYLNKHFPYYSHYLHLFFFSRITSKSYRYHQLICHHFHSQNCFFFFLICETFLSHTQFRIRRTYIYYT